MTFTTLSLPPAGRRGAYSPAIALTALILFATSGNAQETDMSQEPTDAPGVIGEMIFDEQSYDLTLAYWCEPEPGYASGTTVALRVIAYDESGDVIIYGIQVDHDEDRDPVQNVSVAMDPNTNYRSGDIMPSNASYPSVTVESGVVEIRAELHRGGDVEARFTLPDKPGFPGYC